MKSKKSIMTSAVRSNTKTMSTQGSLSVSSHLDFVQGQYANNGRDMPPGKCVINHNAKGYIVWWYIVAFSAVISGVFTPLALAFFPGIRYAEIPLDCVFYTDMIVTFFVSVNVHGWNIRSNYGIFREYISFYFWIDLLAIIPFELMIEDEWGSFLRLFRLLRLRRLFPLFKKAEKSPLCNYTLVSICKYFSMAAYYGHWNACIFYELARLNHFGSNTWVSICVPGLENRGIGAQYLTSLYWAFSTQTTVGYGDISPQSDSERLWGIIYVFVNLLLTAYILGNMTALASKPDSATMQFREHLDDVAVFMKQNNVPVPLRAQVINFLKLQNAMKVTHGNEMINKLPSAIKMPIKRHQYEDILGTVDIFRGVSKPFLAMLMANVEEEIFMAGMPVINCADRCSAFYIITSGQCEVMVSPTGTNQVKMDNELQGARIEAGGHFGSEGFFSSSNQPFTIKVSKLCCCIKVENEVRKEIMTAFPRDIQVVIINIKRRLELMLELLSTGLKKKEEEELKAQAEVLEGNYLPGVAEKKSALKSTPMPFLDYQPPKRGRGRRRRKSTRTIHNFNITNFTRPFMRSVHETRNNVVLYMERHEQDIAATLCQLASVGDHQNLRSMLYGLDLSSDTGDYDGRVPLHLACARGHLEACKVLLKYKANPSHADHFGVTPLQECVKGGHDEVVAYMLRKGAKLAMKDVGGYMCSVAFVGDNKTVERLLKAKADPNAADYDGRTAFHLGCVEGNLSVVKILLHFKANPHLADRWGQTPLSEAKRVGHDVIVRVMMSALKDSAEDATSTQDTANEKDGGTAAAAATTATFAAAATTTGVSSSSSKDSKGTPAPKEAQNKTKGGSKDAETKAAAAAAAQSSPRKPAKARKKKKKPSRPDLSTIISDSPSGNQPGGDKAQEGGGAANEQNLFSPLSPVQMASTPVSKVTPMPQTPDDAGSQEAKSLSGGDKRTIKVGTSLVGGLSDGPNNTTMCATPKTEDSPSNVERKRLIDKGSSS